jgi:hypothetical protein
VRGLAARVGYGLLDLAQQDREGAVVLTEGSNWPGKQRTVADGTVDSRESRGLFSKSSRLNRYPLIWATGSNAYGPDLILIAKGYARLTAVGSRSNGPSLLLNGSNPDRLSRI